MGRITYSILTIGAVLWFASAIAFDALDSTYGTVSLWGSFALLVISRALRRKAQGLPFFFMLSKDKFKEVPNEKKVKEAD